MAIANQEMIRDNNRRLVLEYIVNHPPVSRAALAQKLHLTKATISNIVQELIDQHFISEIGSAQTSLGRKPILLEFQKKCGYALSIDVHPSQIIALTSDLKGENCHLTKYPFQKGDNLYESLRNVIRTLLPSYEAYTYKIVGITIGIYGVVQQNQILFTPYYPLPDSNLAGLLEKEFNIPVFIENESNLSVLGESAFHHHDNNMVLLNIHDGIGMGIMINGHLYRGQDGYAGEIGHTILFPDGRPCPCGNHGCLEQYASEKAILEEYARRIKKNSVTIDDFVRDYQKQIPEALEMMELFSKYISIAINNIINTFNIELVVLNSSFSNYIPQIIGSIQEYLSHHQNRKCQIIPSQLQDISGLIGGVRIDVERFLGIRHLRIQDFSSDTIR